MDWESKEWHEGHLFEDPHSVNVGKQEVTFQPFRYSDLPTEIRLRILRFTDLVLPEHHPFEQIGVIVSGKYAENVPKLFGLAKLSRKLNDDVNDVFFSSNRFVLGGSWRDARNFLHALPDNALRSIRSLKLSVSIEELGEYHDDFSYYDIKSCNYSRRYRFLAPSLEEQCLEKMKEYFPDMPAGQLEDFCSNLPLPQLQKLRDDLPYMLSLRTSRKEEQPLLWQLSLSFGQVAAYYKRLFLEDYRRNDKKVR